VTYQAYCEYKRSRIRPNSASVPVDAGADTGLVRDDMRQETNLTLDQDGLTTKQDSVMPDEVVLTSPESTYTWSQPTLEQALSRWYKLSDTSWSYATTQDSLVLSADVSRGLFNITTLFDRIKRYRYWRGGVKIRLQVNSTPFHYGSLFAAIIPSYNATRMPRLQIPSVLVFGRSPAKHVQAFFLPTPVNHSSFHALFKAPVSTWISLN
jgi:hypothetical protein